MPIQRLWSKSIIGLAVILLITSVATVWAATPIQMTVINESRMEIAFIDFSNPYDSQTIAVNDGLPVSIDIERPNAEANMAMLLFQFKNGDKTGITALPLVRAPKALLDFLALAPEFIVTFYDKDGQT